MLIYTRNEVLTICRRVHDNEARINSSSFTSILEVYSIGVAPQALICFVEMDLIISALQCPQSSKARAAASHHRDFLSALHFPKTEIENRKPNFDNLNLSRGGESWVEFSSMASIALDFK